MSEHDEFLEWCYLVIKAYEPIDAEFTLMVEVINKYKELLQQEQVRWDELI